MKYTLLVLSLALGGQAFAVKQHHRVFDLHGQKYVEINGVQYLYVSKCCSETEDRCCKNTNQTKK